VAAVAFAAWPIATPFAGMAEAAEAAKKPAAADMAAAKRAVLSVILSSVFRSATAPRKNGRVTTFDPSLLCREP
jgi:hypothetical protein